MQKLLYGITGLLVALIVVGLLLPGSATVTVPVIIDAPAATIFAQVNDMRRLALWSPLLDADPNSKIVYSGAPRGAGAMMTWDGNVIGSGTQVIVTSEPFATVTHTINPGEASEASMQFDIAGGVDGRSSVSWNFRHDYGYNLAGRYFGLVFRGIVRRDYEAGLQRLKDLCESLPKTDFSDLEIESLVVEATDIAYLPTTAAPEPGAISAAMGDAYFDILSYIDRHGLTEAGAPMAITRSFSGSEVLFDAAIPVRGLGDAASRDESPVRIGQTYAGSVIRVRHVGSYRTLGATHLKIASYLAALGIERAGDAWESYVSDPTKVAERELLTYIYYPINST